MGSTNTPDFTKGFPVDDLQLRLENCLAQHTVYVHRCEEQLNPIATQVGAKPGSLLMMCLLFFSLGGAVLG
jgi:hypothetical protein